MERPWLQSHLNTCFLFVELQRGSLWRRSSNGLSMIGKSSKSMWMSTRMKNYELTFTNTLVSPSQLPLNTFPVAKIVHYKTFLHRKTRKTLHTGTTSERQSNTKNPFYRLWRSKSGRRKSLFQKNTALTKNLSQSPIFINPAASTDLRTSSPMVLASSKAHMRSDTSYCSLPLNSKSSSSKTLEK